jgi:hypothetical protein
LKLLDPLDRPPMLGLPITRPTAEVRHSHAVVEDMLAVGQDSKATPILDVTEP